MTQPQFSRGTWADGTVIQTKLTREQVADRKAGRPIAYHTGSEHLRVDGDTVVGVESAIPPTP